MEPTVPRRVNSLPVREASTAPGSRDDLLLRVSESYTGDQLSVPVTVLNGTASGPVLFVTAAVHGDELNGIGIIRELLGRLGPADITGSVVCVPFVNVLGVEFHSRYLPDRRDLNRCFPGSPSGSTGSRLAHTLMTQIVAPADAGVDLHTAASHRTNTPQVRVRLDDPATSKLAFAFGAPCLVDAGLRPGSLRDAADRSGVPVLTYEAGQALRFDEEAIATGVAGVLRVLGVLGMIDDPPSAPARTPLVSDETHWIRAERGGIVDVHVTGGEHVEVGQPLWTVTGPFGSERSQKLSPHDGVVIGLTTLPLVNPGDAVVHLAVAGRHAAAWIDEPTDEEDVPSDEDVD